jgi:hypothetical protein
VRIQPRAEFLHAIGPEAVVASLQETLGPQLGQLRFGVSRVDLFSDWQGWSLTLDDAHRFVCRADARRTYETGGILTGFEFGTRKTKTFSARLYDKTADIAAKGNEWWHEVWGDRYVAGTAGPSPGVRDRAPGPDRVRPRHPGPGPGRRRRSVDLRHRAVVDHRSPTDDQTRSRWPLSPQWRPCRRPPSATSPSASSGCGHPGGRPRSPSCCPGLTGYLASLGALIGTEGIDDTVATVGHHLHNYEVISRTPFADRIESRRSELEHR